MNYFFKNDGLSMFDINANIHYLFPIASNISLYPLAGFTYTNWHLDLGKAGDYDVMYSFENSEYRYRVGVIMEMKKQGYKKYFVKLLDDNESIDDYYNNPFKARSMEYFATLRGVKPVIGDIVKIRRRVSKNNPVIMNRGSVISGIIE